MKITLKDLLEEETKLRYGTDVITGEPILVLCQKCSKVYDIGILVVFEGEIKVWCKDCVEKSK